MNSLLLLAAFLLSDPGLTVEELDAHPRPDWVRPCAILNGDWQFDFDPNDAGLNEKWFENHAFTKTIREPFPWQSALSGIKDVDYQGAAWYQREFKVPKCGNDQRIFLVFGAVDFQATVWINGKQMAEHEGGYTPFEVELTGLVKPGESARVTVRAFDVTDPETPTGKQTKWYTRTGGIWQTVYIELRGQTYVRQAHITPDIDKQQAVFNCTVEAPAPGEYTLAIQASEDSHRFICRQSISCKAGANEVQAVLSMPNPKLWSPDSPMLYNARIELQQGKRVVDSVQTYFGMRKIARGVYGDAGHEYILLNNKPVYLRGALHQSFNPQGIYTHPSDEFIRNDYQKAKELGLNFVRIHIKVDEPRALYWADKLGVMLMCDMPNFNKNSPRSHKLWEEMLRAAVARDFNHPAIIAWCDFNETWGIRDGGYTREVQEWVRDMYLLTKQLDPSRLAEDNSACNFDHVKTDINSWHFYINDWKKAADHIAKVVEKTVPGSTFNYADGWQQDTAPLINSEYGGISSGSGDADISWCFLFLTNLLRKYDKICGYVYTELEDIEWEHNGFMNYDRSPKEFHYPAGITAADLQTEEFPVLDCPPYQQVDAGAKLNIPVLLSHWSEREGLKLRISADGTSIDGIPWSTYLKSITRDVTAKPYCVTPQQPLDIQLPVLTGILNIVVEVMDNDRRVGANYCVLDVRGAPAWDKPTEYAAPFRVDGFSDYGFSEKSLLSATHPSKVFGFGAGYIEYKVKLPRGLTPDIVKGCRLIAEMGSKANTERLDWPEKRKPSDYPQTDGKQWPSDVTLSVNGVAFHQVTLENDCADARGVLSHVAQWHAGSCGTVVEAPITGDALTAVLNALAGERVLTLRFEVRPDAKNKGGLALYGKDMGVWPSDPTLVFTLASETEKPGGKARVVGAEVKPASKVLQWLSDFNKKAKEKAKAHATAPKRPTN